MDLKMPRLIRDSYPEDIGIIAADLPLNPYSAEWIPPSPYGNDEIPF